MPVDLDPNEGTAYSSVGTIQLESVPYAMHANISATSTFSQTSGHATTAVNATNAEESLLADRSLIANRALIADSVSSDLNVETYWEDNDGDGNYYDDDVRIVSKDKERRISLVNNTAGHAFLYGPNGEQNVIITNLDESEDNGAIVIVDDI